MYVFSQIYPDKFAEREMMTLQVLCKANKENECLWKGPLGDLEVFLMCVSEIEGFKNLRFLRRKIKGLLVPAHSCNGDGNFS